jgi:hypothetical protein
LVSVSYALTVNATEPSPAEVEELLEAVEKLTKVEGMTMLRLAS